MKFNIEVCPLPIEKEVYDKVVMIVNPLLSESFGENLPPDAHRSVWEMTPLIVGQNNAILLLVNTESDYVGLEINGDLRGKAEDITVKWFTYQKPFPTINYHENPDIVIYDPWAGLPSELLWADKNAAENRLSLNWLRKTLVDVEIFFADEGIRDDDWQASPALYKKEDSMGIYQVSILCTNEKTGSHLGFLFLQNEGHWTQSRCTFVIHKDSICYFSTIQEALSIEQDKLPASEISRYTARAFYH